MNQDQTTWFLCQPDYAGTGQRAFLWDEFKRLSIESAENDDGLIAEIRAFWDVHLPIMLSVAGHYSFYAVRTAPDRFGEVVKGDEPLFEETTAVAGSLSDFVARGEF